MASELGVGTTFWFDLALAQSDKDELLTKAINNSDSFSGSEIKEIRMGLDKDTQDFKGFAHIEVVSDGDLARALNKNGKDLLGREMKVAYATERKTKKRR